LVELREAIRDAAAGRGTPAEAAAVAALDGFGSAHPVTVRLGSSPLPFAPVGTGIPGFTERVLGILAAAAIDGTWQRLKACPNDRCRWLFYDHSRNRSRTWCSMGVCGARSKMRTYRARRRAEGARAVGA
jgi:predicted RNA-binding Zn ribbon-like protein